MLELFLRCRPPPTATPSHRALEAGASTPEEGQWWPKVLEELQYPVSAMVILHFVKFYKLLLTWEFFSNRDAPSRCTATDCLVIDMHILSCPSPSGHWPVIPIEMSLWRCYPLRHCLVFQVAGRPVSCKQSSLTLLHGSYSFIICTFYILHLYIALIQQLWLSADAL